MLDVDKIINYGGFMTTIVASLTNACGGGNHLDFRITVDGQATNLRGVDISELTQPITDDDKLTLLKIIVRGVKAGKTVAQAQTLLQAGVTVVL